MKIFIASAIARHGFEDRVVLLSTLNLLAREYGKNSVYLARGIYQEPEKVFAESKRQVREADVFILFSPEGPATAGVLVELGLALALDKPALALIGKADGLPFFLRRDTGTLTVLLCGDVPGGIPFSRGPKDSYFRVIKAYIENKAFAPPDDAQSLIEESYDGPDEDCYTEDEHHYGEDEGCVERAWVTPEEAPHGAGSSGVKSV